MSEACTRLAGYGRRGHTIDGWRRRITAIKAEGNRLLIDAEFTELATGRFIRIAEDQPSPLNGIRLTKPGILVPDSEVVVDGETQVTFREDAAAAIKIHLDRVLTVALNYLDEAD